MGWQGGNQILVNNPHDSGVLDNTHLRFFTRKSIFRLFEMSGYELSGIKGLQVSPQWYQSMSVFLTNIITLGYYNDSGFIQFARVAKACRE